MICMYRVKIVHSYPLYHADIAYFDNKPVLNKVPTDNLLANYVLPSVKNLNELNQYSRIKNLNSIQYRVPKDAIFDGESKGTYHFIYTIFYPKFLSAEEVQKLRNMFEFFDSTNNPEFKLQQHVVFPENR